jgi:cell cycle checkpoint control protein RAD9A
MALNLDLHFTDPASPLFIDIEGDNSEILFVIAPVQLAPNANIPSQAQSAMERSVNSKRAREEDSANGDGGEGSNTRTSTPRFRLAERERVRKPMKAVHRVDPASIAHAGAISSTLSRPKTVHGSMAPPASIPLRPLSQTPIFSQSHRNVSNGRDPLFLPGSQLSAADEEAIRGSGLGIESMGADELEALLEGDGEEVAFDFGSQRAMSQVTSGDFDGAIGGDEDDPMDEEGPGNGDGFDVIEEMELEPTQEGGAKVFLFCTQLFNPNIL